MVSISQIKTAIKKGDLFKKAFCLLLIKLGFSNTVLQTLEVRNKNYLYVKKRYAKYIEKFKDYEANSDEREQIIWVLWLQGIDNAPALIQACCRSIMENAGEYKVVFLDSTNYTKYATLPEYIVSKWKKGIISNTHFADILRTELMILHGGIWMDATTLLTGDLPEYITKTDFFVYKRGMIRDITTLANNWLISSNRNNRLLLCVREMLFEYWKQENKLIEYFIWQNCFTIAAEVYKKDWDEVLHIPDTLPETMAWNIFKKYDPKVVRAITDLSPVHKLSYKLKTPSDYSNTIYEKILVGEII